MAGFVVEDTPREGIAGIAGHVVGKHEDDLGVGDSQTFDGAVEGEGVGQVSIVEPESGGADQNGPVGGVGRSRDIGDGEEREQRAGEGEESHRGSVFYGLGDGDGDGA